jgi:competence ComEA-like helix-hairpin-helix protein
LSLYQLACNIHEEHSMPKTLPPSQSPIIVLPDGDDFDTDDDFGNFDEDPSRWHWIWLVMGIAAAIGFFALGVFSNSQTEKSNVIIPADSGSTPGATPLVVDVAGQVNKPGVYEFPFNARVRDAILKAGGPAKNADLNSVNLAAYLEDGQKIEVLPKPSTPVTAAPASEDSPLPPAEHSRPEPGAPPSSLPDFGAPEPEKPQPQKREKRSAGQPQKPRVLPDVPRADTANGEESQNADPAYLAKHPLNLNSASAEQLELLPGVGPAMAAKIIAARQQKGGFKSIEELDEIPGIGAKTMEKLRPLVTVS